MRTTDTAMQQIRVDQVPAYVEWCREVAKRHRAEFAKYVEKAKATDDPELRRMHQDFARTALDIATALEFDADDLTSKFQAAGGEIHRLQ
jgi:hypothetical protein